MGTFRAAEKFRVTGKYKNVWMEFALRSQKFFEKVFSPKRLPIYNERGHASDAESFQSERVNERFRWQGENNTTPISGSWFQGKIMLNWKKIKKILPRIHSKKPDHLNSFDEYKIGFVVFKDMMGSKQISLHPYIKRGLHKDLDASFLSQTDFD